MNNLLENAADNIFIASANVLDTLTYRFSSTATDVTVPNNNDTLTAPLTEQLAKDFDTFNQVLNDYRMDLSNCVYILNSMKTKNKKEKVIRAKREQQRLEEERLRMIKEKEENERQEKLAQELKEKQDLQSVVADTNVDDDDDIDLFGTGVPTPPSVSASNVNLNSNNNTNTATNDNNNLNASLNNDGDDLMLDLDLDNFNFDGAGADVMNFDFNDPMSSLNSAPSTTTPITTANTATTAPAPSKQPEPAKTAVTNSGSNDYLNFGQDADLADLNLDFLQDDEMGNLMQNIADDAGHSSNTKNDNEMNDDALGADQMEQLFSQFDEMVGNGI